VTSSTFSRLKCNKGSNPSSKACTRAKVSLTVSLNTIPTCNPKTGTSRKSFPQSQPTKPRLLSFLRSFQLTLRPSKKSTLRWPRWPKLYPRSRLRYLRLVVMSIRGRRRRLSYTGRRSLRKKSSTRSSSRFKRPVRQV
jgi:hypothetical protein